MDEPETHFGGTEVVIGLVGAIGVDMGTVQSLIEKSLKGVGFKAKQVHLSELLAEVPGFTPETGVDSQFYDEKVNALMDSGTKLREALAGNAMAMLAILKMKELREEITGDPLVPADRQAYILRQLKHQDEVLLLREVYGEAFFLFGAYCLKAKRLENLTEKIRESRHRHRAEDFEALAVKLMHKDEEEPDRILGQHVRDTFWRADAYLDARSEASAEKDIDRVIRLWFGSPFITPSRDEFGMFIARAAAQRSACMGRQVGASICTPEGSVIATGTNEIPKADGGQYWEGDSGDARDHVLGYDSSETMRRALLEDALDRLMEAKWSPPENKATSELASDLLKHPVMVHAELQALTEYQRPVHAEMAALCDAALRGVSVSGATLYSSTFPCHGCARHIVAAGIRRVVYIEPYAKSLVKTLYGDSILVDDEYEGDPRVQFVPFIGLAPRRYLGLFRAPKRKDENGRRIEWDAVTAMPRVNHWESWLAIRVENRIVVEFRLHLRKLGWIENGADAEQENGGTKD